MEQLPSWGIDVFVLTWYYYCFSMLAAHNTEGNTVMRMDDGVMARNTFHITGHLCGESLGNKKGTGKKITQITDAYMDVSDLN